MAGLSLNVGGYGSAAMPVAANTAAGPSISQQAFGVTAAGPSRGNAIAAYGSVGAGLFGAVILLWLWYSLPR
jgi:hypothetical protein